jgi:hypothetical protein
MTAPLIIWASCGLAYLVFLAWYVGFKKKVSTDEVEKLRKFLQDNIGHSPRRIEGICQFFENDDGKDFVMVNLLELKRPHEKSREKLQQYQTVFLGSLLKRAGHPVFIASAAGGNIESIDCDSDKWTGAGMVRYRSRRDLLEMLPSTVGSEHHKFKLEALDRTFAFPASPWMLFGGPKVLIPLVLALLGALGHLALL